MTVTQNDLNGVIDWIKDYFYKADINKAIIGLSGGIDSAVIASLCVRALGEDNVIGIWLPCYSQRLDKNLVDELTVNLNINTGSFNLEDAFNLFWKEYRSKNYHIFPDTYNKLVPANIKARLRMTTLYAVAGHVSGLVVGTTNKTEALLGYATKYGDGGVDIEPIQDFYKTEVYELAELLRDIPQEIIDRAPSAGLWDGQTDEGELGTSYYLIDLHLKCMDSENEEQFSPTVLQNLSKDTEEKIKSLIAANKHKNMHLPYYKRSE